MEIPSELKKSYEQLLKSQQFLQNICEYTKSALQVIYSLEPSQKVQTPPGLIFLLSHLISSRQPLQNFVNSLPNQYHQSVTKILQLFDVNNNEQILQMDNAFYNNLCDVKWQMYIQNGRQIWEVKLYTFQNDSPFVMKLNYEQLSVLTFKVSQAVNHIASINSKQ